MMLASIRNGLTLALLTVAAGTGTAFAHPNAGELDVGLFGGYHIFGTENILGSEKGDTVGTIDDGPIFGLRVGYVVVSRIGVEAEGGMFLSNPRVQFDQDVIGFHARGNVTLRITPDDLGGDLFLLGGAGIMTVGKSDDGLLKSDTKFMPHFGLGANVEVGDHWGLRFDGRAFISKNTSDDTQMTYEGLIGFYYAFGRKPHETAPAKPLDGDGDGINDDVDKCPTEAEDADNFQDDDGCPDPDNDGDGIPDAGDKCPMEAGPGTPDGCPDKDDDGDGIMNSKDKCPTEAEDKDGFQDDDGCPDPDNDGDGVPDAQDKCGDKPETKNGFQDDDGCPDEIPEAVKKFTGTIKGINFVTNSAKIAKSSNKTLDAAVAVLKENPSVKIEIGGHTDDVGDMEKNKTLSQQRADSVKAYLVSKGVEEGRLKAVGYGYDKPIDPAKTKAARAKNRRVEFVLITE